MLECRDGPVSSRNNARSGVFDSATQAIASFNNSHQVATVPTPDNQAALKKFSELGLFETIFVLDAAGYERPTDIQAGVIPGH